MVMVMFNLAVFFFSKMYFPLDFRLHNFHGRYEDKSQSRIKVCCLATICVHMDAHHKEAVPFLAVVTKMPSPWVRFLKYKNIENINIKYKMSVLELKIYI